MGPCDSRCVHGEIDARFALFLGAGKEYLPSRMKFPRRRDTSRSTAFPVTL